MNVRTDVSEGPSSPSFPLLKAESSLDIDAFFDEHGGNNNNNDNSYGGTWESSPFDPATLNATLFGELWSPSFAEFKTELKNSGFATNNDISSDISPRVEALAGEVEMLRTKVDKLTATISDLLKWAVALNPVMGMFLSQALSEDVLEGFEVQAFVECGETLNEFKEH